MSPALPKITNRIYTKQSQPQPAITICVIIGSSLLCAAIKLLPPLTWHSYYIHYLDCIMPRVF